MPKFEDIIGQRAGIMDEEETCEDHGSVPKSAEPEPEERFDRRKFKRITKKDAVPEEEKEAFTEMQRRVELDKSKTAENPLLVEKLEKMIDALPEREREVIRRRFFHGQTYGQIGKAFGITREPIRKNEAQALRRLRLRSKRYSEDDEFSDLISGVHPFILEGILEKYIDSQKVKNNQEIHGLLNEIFSSVSKNWKCIFQFNPLISNYICDKIKAILDKKKYDEHDVAELKDIEKRLREEIEKVKGGEEN